MPENEFDQFAEKYDEILDDSMPEGMGENPYFAEYKIKLIADLLGGRVPTKILDFGCGAGRGLPYVARYFPDSEVSGFDVSEASLDVARTRAPEVTLVSDMKDLNDERFDLIVAANVFHHILPDERIAALSDCRKVLADKGKMFIFEHNPYNPATRWVFDRCPFDVDAEMLSKGSASRIAKQANFKVADSGYTLFFPAPLAFLRGFEKYLKMLPLGAQYYVELEK